MKVKPESLLEIVEHCRKHDREAILQVKLGKSVRVYWHGDGLFWRGDGIETGRLEFTEKSLNMDNWRLLTGEEPEVQEWPRCVGSLVRFVCPENDEVIPKIEYSGRCITLSEGKFVCTGFRHKGLLNGAFASQPIMWTDRKGNFNECKTGIFKHRSLATHAIMEEE